MNIITTALIYTVVFLIIAIAGAISFILISTNVELHSTRRLNHNGHFAKRKRLESLDKEWAECYSLYDLTVKEALPILDEALTDGFEIKITNSKIYYR